MKVMTCTQLGGPCDVVHKGESADAIIKLHDAHLRESVASGDDSHAAALKDMKGRWRNPISGMGWYRAVKREFAALREE